MGELREELGLFVVFKVSVLLRQIDLDSTIGSSSANLNVRKLSSAWYKHGRISFNYARICPAPVAVLSKESQ